MAFTPAYIPRTQHVDAKPFAYNVRYIAWQRRKDEQPGTSKPYLYFRIAEHIAKRCGFDKGDCIRLDFDVQARQGRIIRVLRSSRHVCQGRNDRAVKMVFPYTGDLAANLPESRELQELHILDTSVSEGLIFELPAKSKP